MEVVEAKEIPQPFTCECGEMVKIMMDRDISFFCNKCGFKQVLARTFQDLNTDFLDRDNNWERTVVTCLMSLRSVGLEIQKRPSPEATEEMQKKIDKATDLLHEFDRYVAYLSGLARAGNPNLSDAALEKYKP